MSSAPPANAKAHVLVVDDEPAARSALARLLSGEGYSVDIAESGKAALDLVAARRPAIVVTDIDMPGMNGIELLAKLHASDRDLPVIVATALADLGSAVTAMRAGADDFIAKPADLDHITLVIERALQRRATRDEADFLRQQIRERDHAATSSVRIPGASMEEIEREAILKTLDACDGSTTRAAEVLGISVRTIQYRLHQYGRARQPAGGTHVRA